MVDSPEQLPVRLDGGDAGGHLNCLSGAVRQANGAKTFMLMGLMPPNGESEVRTVSMCGAETPSGVECTPPLEKFCATRATPMPTLIC